MKKTTCFLTLVILLAAGHSYAVGEKMSSYRTPIVEFCQNHEANVLKQTEIKRKLEEKFGATGKVKHLLGTIAQFISMQEGPRGLSCKVIDRELKELFVEADTLLK
ncbi:MAG: hypothetical protein Q8L85_08590 [Alphaproteobacteria bacterium]|nr:hypothetical protein [Alphaproteobacteria bacterium]